ncbi:MAG: Hemin transport protein HemS [Candidatus Erwinia impunctatus]|nr:Hemin transport protein HemS [Culicoides impunctatus]
MGTMASYQNYLDVKANHPKKYARDIATLMGISEAELTQIRTEQEAVALNADFQNLLMRLEAVGETLSVTRNSYAVHEQVGRYENIRLSDHAGLVLNPRALDQRIFLQKWKSVFALHEKSDRGDRYSIQIFDAQGDAVLKVHTTANTDMTAWQALVADFTAKQPVELSISEEETPDWNTSPDAAQVEKDWRAMNDVHQFFGLLKRHNLPRPQAFRLVPDDLAVQIDNSALGDLLRKVQAAGNEIMIFIGNRGCVQIFTGKVEKVVPMEHWINIFNPGFTLHLMENTIAESWITRKNTADGVVTSLELFAADGTQIAQLYGQRTEGQPEQTCWREQLASLQNEGVIA